MGGVTDVGSLIKTFCDGLLTEFNLCRSDNEWTRLFYGAIFQNVAAGHL